MEQVSWRLYVMLVSVVVGIYYLYVGIRYYRQDFKILLKRALKPPNPKEIESIRVDELKALNQVARILEESFDELAGIEVTQEEALSLAREQLSGRPGLEKQVIKEALEQLVAGKAKVVFGLELTQSELKTIWQD